MPLKRCLERSTSILFLVTHRNPLTACNEGQEWKSNHDSEAATTDFPVELVVGFSLRKVGGFIVANGQATPGRAKSQTVGEFGNNRRSEGQLSEVHKPLASAGEISKYHNAFMFEEFGALTPRHSPIAIKHYDESTSDCVSRMVIKERCLCIEKDDCRINCVKRASNLEMVPVEPIRDVVMDEQANTSSRR